MDRTVLARKPMTELRDIADALEMRGYQKLRKAELIDAIIGEATGDGGEQLAIETDDGARKVLPPEGEDGSSGDDGHGAESGAADGGSAADGSDGDARSGDGPGSGDDAGSGDDGGDDGGRNRGRRSRRDRRRRDRDQDDDRRDGRGGGDGAGEDRDRGDRGRGADDQSAKGQNGKDQNGKDRNGKGQSGKGQNDRSQNERGQDGDDGGDGEIRAGVLDILPEGYGFLRTTGYLPGERDVYVSQGQIRKHGLRRGDVVQGPIRPQRNNEKVPALHHVQQVNGEALERNQVPDRPTFEDLPMVSPSVGVPLGEAGRGDLARVVDLVTPLLLGHRLLLTADHASDPSAALRALADDVAEALPDAHVMSVMVDVRPEDIAAAATEVPGEVIATGFDGPPESHVQVCELAIERARRLAELGHDVVVLLDSAPRLAVACSAVGSSGKGAATHLEEVTSLAEIKRLLATARDLEDAGSVTIITTGTPLTSGAPHTGGDWNAELERIMSSHLALLPASGLLPDLETSWSLAAAGRAPALHGLAARLDAVAWPEQVAALADLLRTNEDTATLVDHLTSDGDS